MAETNFKSRSFLLKGKRRQVPFPLLSVRTEMQARAMEELLAILQKPHPDGNYVGLRNQYLNKTCDCPVLTPRAPCWAGCSQIWGAFSRKLWVPESEGKCSRGRILIQKACVDDLALILYNTENTCNILYDPLRIFLLQLWVTALER